MTKKTTFVPPPPKVVGVHADCGGEVVYIVSASYSFTRCQKCSKNSMHGQVLLTTEVPS